MSEKLRIVVLAKDGRVVEYSRAPVAHRRVRMERERTPEGTRDVRREYEVQCVLRLDEQDEDPVVLYREVQP